MPQRNAVPMSWTPRGLTDALDGTTSFPGAMKTLQNIIPAPSTAQLWQPRPAAQRKTNFTTAGAPANAGNLSAMLVIGDRLYGMVPSTLNSGSDEPYVLDLATNFFVAVSGITAANVPATIGSSGDWTPPIMAAVGSRIIVTHPGFSGASQFSQATTGNTHSSTLIDGNPDILGVLPGMAISGSGIPAGAEIVDAAYFQLNTTGDTHGNTTVDNLANTTGVAVGQRVLGSGISAGTTVVAVVSPTEVTISSSPAAVVGAAIVFAGATIQISMAATASANGVAVTIAGASVLFGWFDISGFSQTTGIERGGVTLSGSPVIRGNVSILGVQPGMTISGSGIPAGASVVGTENFVMMTTGTTVSGSTTMTGVQNLQGVFIGTRVEGLGIPIDTFVAGFVAGSQITLSKPATASATVVLTFTGSTITMSAAATITANQVDLTIAGGTRAAPLWGAGDTDWNGLPSKPVGVAQMNGRAYFADGLDGIPFSDSGFACRRTSGTQALTTNDGLAVTALGQQQLATPLTGGIVQALIAFEGVNKLQQITGDPASGDLKMNVLPEATGTDAPLSIVPIGGARLAFISPLGLRTVGLAGAISQPIGVDGMGITQPFQFAVSPSRICAAYNVGVLRITVQNGITDEVPFEEYWFDVARGIWHGPHTFPARLIQPWRSSFVTAPLVASASLWQSDAFSNNASGYIENGNQLSWIMRTVLLPDNAQVAMNAIVVSNLACVGSATDPLVITALDENSIALDIVFMPATVGNRNLRQRGVNWTQPLIFKQISFRVTGPSELGVLVGNHYSLYEPLGYPIGDDDAPFYLLSSRTPFPILNADDGTHLFPG